MQLGIDQLASCLAQQARGARVGLVCHAASYSSAGQHAVDVVAQSAAQLGAIFGPEHGVGGVAADMECVGQSTHPTLGVPVHSLYGQSVASLTPPHTWLRNLDLLVIDLQDIGTRYYTYVNTTANCLRVCNELGLPALVCDRPNPINGVTIEGPLVQSGFHSFVGQYPIPVRHGMTIGELAQYIHARERWTCSLTVLRMDGWRREWHWDDTGVRWDNPSPNMRSLTAALLYPGACLLEATNISEGRGTESPFEICGAPWIDGKKLAASVRALNLPGIACSPIHFTPTARKFVGASCGGIHCTVTDRAAFQPYRFGLALLWALAAHDRTAFQWRTPAGNPPHTGLDAGPYEFVTDRPAIDLLTGSAAVRHAIDSQAEWAALELLSGPTPQVFLEERLEKLLYPY